MDDFPLDPEPAEIRRALALLAEPGSVVEMRCLHTARGTVSGYYDDMERLAEDAAKMSGTCPAVYISLNPVKPELLARAKNRAIPFARHTTSDADIVRRRWLGIDLDPVRAAAISSSDAEHAAALARARECREWLREVLGWPDLVLADSGNGAHLLGRIDMPNDDASRILVEQCLMMLHEQFSDEAVVVDRTTGNAARIWKLYGTLAAKGDELPDRPHRLARLLEGLE